MWSNFEFSLHTHFQPEVLQKAFFRNYFCALMLQRINGSFVLIMVETILEM